MLTYNMDVTPESVWKRTTPSEAELAQPYYCTEAGVFYAQQHFSTARTDKESYLLFYTLRGAGLIEQGESHVVLSTVDSMVTMGLALHEMLALCARSILAQTEATSARQVILQAAETLRKNYQKELCLADLLAEAHMSKSYFLRLFRRYMGTTPYNYLVNFRITQAKELLVLTDHSVSEIAQEVGFGDASNFSTRFAKATGQSPLQYRKSALKPVEGAR